MSIRWDKGPPRALPPSEVEVWNCPPGKSGHFVRFLGDPIAVWLHWIEPTASKTRGRTTPCRVKECTHCKSGDAGQRTAYAPALVWKAKDPDWPHVREWVTIVAQLSECAESDIIAVKNESPWRNLTVAIQRVGRKNNRVTAQLAAKQHDDPIPPAFDVLPTLLRMWNERAPEGREPDKADPAGDETPRVLPFEKRGAR